MADAIYPQGRRQCQYRHCRKFLRNKPIPGRKTWRRPPAKYCNKKCAGREYGLRVRGSGDSHIMIWVDGKREYLHVLVMEKKLGRKLLPGEIVHHKDENNKNNDPANLKLETRQSHIQQHGWWRQRNGRTEPDYDLDEQRERDAMVLEDWQEDDSVDMSFNPDELDRIPYTPYEPAGLVEDEEDFSDIPF